MTTLRQKWRTFRRLDAVRRWCLFEALVLPPLIWIGFRLAGVPRTQNLLRHWGAPSQAPSATADSNRAIEAACWAQRFIKRKAGVGGSCLVRSLTLWTMLRRRGVESDLRIGFRKSATGIKGHAWLEYSGKVLNEDERVASTYLTTGDPMNFDILPLFPKSMK